MLKDIGKYYFNPQTNNKWSKDQFTLEEASILDNEPTGNELCTNCVGCKDCYACYDCTNCDNCEDCAKCKYCSECNCCCDCTHCDSCFFCDNTTFSKSCEDLQDVSFEHLSIKR